MLLKASWPAPDWNWLLEEKYGSRGEKGASIPLRRQIEGARPKDDGESSPRQLSQSTQKSDRLYVNLDCKGAPSITDCKITLSKRRKGLSQEYWQKKKHSAKTVRPEDRSESMFKPLPSVEDGTCRATVKSILDAVALCDHGSHDRALSMYVLPEILNNAKSFEVVSLSA